ncbi:invasion associated locus B family protein [Stappia stellulata]|uniref:invasion associated locus B family protein n=1 Tax=Stappia stellulata TaxID=71235 RepID=UPI0003F73FDD|nr:invasion associated locus B family protein [Stappia stellulata]
MIDFALRRARRLGAATMVAAGFALAFGLGASGPVQAQSGGEQGTGEPAQNWVVQCSEETPKQCRAMQNIVMQKTSQRLLTVVVEPREGAPNHALVLALPHGVFLPAGATVKVDDGAPAPMVIQTSDANGAYAGMAISDELLASLKKGTQLTVAFKTAQRKDLAVPVTLIGFTAAYSQLGG